MATIESPTVRAYADTMHINNIEFPALPIRSDDASVQQYCTENSIALDSYTADSTRYSNDGARLYNYYDTTTSQWMNSWGYAGIVTEITHH